MSALKNKMVANVKNIIWGKKVPQKMVIFESDDWGSNRIASINDHNNLIKSGILSEKSNVYDMCDTIARSKDLEVLFETLTSVKDANGKHAVFTNFFSPTNPNYEKIEADDFRNYYSETFLETLAKTGEDKAVSLLWKQGTDAGVIVPAYHAREHLCVQLWMQYLQQNEQKVRDAFKYNFYSVPLDSLPKMASAFRPTLFFTNKEQMNYIGNSLIDGLKILKDLFQVNITTFAPPNGISHPFFDKILNIEGIKTIHNMQRFEPDGFGGGTKRHSLYPGKNKFGQRFYNRNCRFEPEQVKNDVDLCLTQIEGAFNWHKPAIISSHRVNYIGYINPKNREEGNKQLHILLKTIMKKWPDVIFASSEDYSKILHNIQ